MDTPIESLLTVLAAAMDTPIDSLLTVVVAPIESLLTAAACKVLVEPTNVLTDC